MKKKKDKRPTQMNLMIRCLVAMYLIYLAHSIISELNTAQKPRLMFAFAIVFTFAGVLIIAFTVKAFINKDYKDMMDLSDDDEEEDAADAEASESEGTIIDEVVTDTEIINKKETGNTPDGKEESGEADNA